MLADRYRERSPILRRCDLTAPTAERWQMLALSR
jgi:hypothetical protein